MPGPVMEAAKAAKRYQRKQVLFDVELKVSRGEFLALLGPNGSGKSTLMRLLGAQELPDGGDVRFLGRSTLDPSAPIGQSVAFVSEDAALPFPISVSEWARLFSGSHADYDLGLFASLCARLQVAPESRYAELSRGQRAKAYFALHAAKRPTAYLLDEITSVLDSGSRLALMRFLSDERSRGAAIVMSTNVASEMQGFATDVCVMKEGRLDFQEPVANLDRSFVKVRVPSQSRGDFESRALDEGARPRALRVNSDGSTSYLAPRGDARPEWGVWEDRRAVSVEDVALYYTLGDVRV